MTVPLRLVVHFHGGRDPRLVMGLLAEYFPAPTSPTTRSRSATRPTTSCSARCAVSHDVCRDYGADMEVIEVKATPMSRVKPIRRVGGAVASTGSASSPTCTGDASSPLHPNRHQARQTQHRPSPSLEGAATVVGRGVSARDGGCGRRQRSPAESTIRFLRMVSRTTTFPRVTRLRVPSQRSSTSQRVPRTVAWLFFPWVRNRPP